MAGKPLPGVARSTEPTRTPTAPGPGSRGSSR